MAVGFPTKANWAAGDVLTASAMDDLAGTVNTTQYMKPWNGVINSNFSIWQRGTSIAGTASATTYSADRWQIYRATSNMTVSRQTVSDTTNLPNIQYCGRVQRTAADTTTAAPIIANSFETLNAVPFAGKQIVISFYARAGANFSAASNALNFLVVTGTGTDQNIISGFTGQANAITGVATLTTTMQRFQATATLPATTTEIGLQFYYTPTGTAGVNDYFDITGVQLEQGSVANTYQPNQATYQGELAACQRYYQRNTVPTAAYAALSPAGWVFSTTRGTWGIPLPVPMRITPTSLDTGNIACNKATTDTRYSSGTWSLGGSNGTNNSIQEVFYTHGSAVFVQGDLVVIQTNSASNQYIGFSAEL